MASKYKFMIRLALIHAFKIRAMLLLEVGCLLLIDGAKLQMGFVVFKKLQEHAVSGLFLAIAIMTYNCWLDIP